MRKIDKIINLLRPWLTSATQSDNLTLVALPCLQLQFKICNFHPRLTDE